MIAKITGKVIEKGSNHLVLEAGNLCYEVFIPTTVMQRIDDTITEQGVVSLVTYHYYQMEPSRSTPVLIGFLNEVEKDFFGIFITVSGIGPKAALKALNKPISLIAHAIDEGNVAFLKSLPGIGPQRAKEIVAKLQYKVGKFGLIQDSLRNDQEEEKKDIFEEALAVLMQLEYKKLEATAMIKNALEMNPGIAATEELLNVVYRQRKLR
ncbi:MAG: hypothetical protein KKC84_00440 [Candidatus Omnitrophica bacterium]|nr:hypothetical protein [Candidatus Omnitrophota bacterium]